MKKVYTRFFVYLTCCVLVLSFAVAPVSADIDEESSIVNYFDYNYAEAFYTLTPTNNTITFPLHQRQYVRYVELFIATGQGFDSVSLIRGSITNELSVISLGTGFYKVYGGFGGGGSAWTDELKLVFDLSKNAQIQIWSFRYSLFNYWDASDIGTIEVLRMSDDDTITETMPGKNMTAMVYFSPSNSEDHFLADFYTENWRKYDYISFMIGVNSAGIESVEVDIDGVAVPFEMSYLDSVDSDVYGFNVTWLHVCIDVSGIYKTHPSYPIVRITGALDAYYDDYYIALLEVVGSILVDDQSPTTTWFQRLIDTIKDVFNPDDSAASDAGEKMESAADELSSGSAAFDKVETPDINTGNLINKYVNFNPGGLSILTSLTSNPYVTQMMIVVFTFALCGYIFFGKKR